MGFCANCGQPRNGNVRFCGSCGTEFDDSPAAPDEPTPQASGWTAPADATRTDMSPRDTLIDPPGAKAGQPDPFASWYSSAEPAAAPEPPRGNPGTYWQQPTETVRPTPPGPGGYPAPPPAGYGAPPAPGGYPTARPSPAGTGNAPYPPGRDGGKTAAARRSAAGGACLSCSPSSSCSRQAAAPTRSPRASASIQPPARRRRPRRRRWRAARLVRRGQRPARGRPRRAQARPRPVLAPPRRLRRISWRSAPVCPARRCPRYSSC